MTTAVLLVLPTVSDRSPAAAQATKPDQTTTIAGCLVQENRDGTNDYFVRTPTVAVPVGTTVTVGKPGTLDTTTSAGKPTHDSLYRITGLNRDQLRPHLGHRIEVQGHLSSRKPDASAAGVTSTKTTVDKDGKPTVTVEKRVDVAGDLHATTLKMVSATCK
jgi:hypothetical protein